MFAAKLIRCWCPATWQRGNVALWRPGPAVRQYRMLPIWKKDTIVYYWPTTTVVVRTAEEAGIQQDVFSVFTLVRVRDRIPFVLAWTVSPSAYVFPGIGVWRVLQWIYISCSAGSAAFFIFFSSPVGNTDCQTLIFIPLNTIRYACLVHPPLTITTPGRVGWHVWVYVCGTWNVCS